MQILKTINSVNSLLFIVLLFWPVFYFGGITVFIVFSFFVIYFIKKEIEFYRVSLFIFVFYVIYYLIIMFFLHENLYVFSYYRVFSQAFMLLFFYVSYLLGRAMGGEVNNYELENYINYGFLLILAFGVYQAVAINVGLPNWGISIHRSYSAIDAAVGKRVTSLAGEPRYFAVILVTYISYLLFSLFEKKGRNGLVCLLITSIILLLMTYSGSGVFALLISSFLLFCVLLKRHLLLLPLVLILMLFVLPYVLNVMLQRESLSFILDFFQSGNINLSSFDDPIKISFAMWADSPQFLLFGSGLGLHHYLASKYLYLADWIHLSGSYIDGPGIVHYISFLGVWGVALILISSSFYLIKNFSRVSFLIFNLIVLDLFVGIPQLPIFFFLGLLHTRQQHENHQN